VTSFSQGATNKDTSKSTPLVSIIMPILNEEKYLARCLQTVVEQDYPPDKLEILVVDGLSDDRSREIVAEFMTRFPQIKLLDNPKRSIPAAMNIGIRSAKGEVIVRVDGHCFLARDYVSQCLRHLQETGAANVGGPAWAIGEGYVGEAIPMALGSPFGHGGSQFRYAQQEQYVDTVFLGAFRRDLFDQIGFYDEGLLCAEDYELNYRLRAANGKILLTPQIRVRYIARHSLVKFGKQYFRYGFWRMLVIKKHPRALRWRHLATAGFVLTLLVGGVAGLFSFEFKILFLIVFLSYLAAASFFSILLAWRQGWRYLPILPVIFAILHLSWGSGFLWGLARLCLRRVVFK